MTPIQLKLLHFIDATIKNVGMAPNFHEMQAYLGLASKSGPYLPLTALEKMGFVRRHRGRTRGIEVIRMPGDPEPPPLPPPPRRGLSAVEIEGLALHLQLWAAGAEKPSWTALAIVAAEYFKALP